MASLYNADLKPLGRNDSTHPYDHAGALFIADNLRLAPKQKFLYYVVVNIDVGIVQNILTNSQSLLDPTSSQSLIEQYEAGLMAKRVDLPKFTMNTKTLNAYNRKNIAQTHIQYDPVSITFHDDAADVITNLWNDYYTYYYRDSDYNPTLYQLPHKYQPRNREGWGYSPRNQNLKPFFRNIQIYSLHNKRFTEYTLINPYITSWRHGEHDSYAGAETMESTMTLAYETVKYRTGYVNPVDVNGFSLLHYDNYNSPISTSTTNVYSDSGMLGAAAGSTRDLARPDGTTGGAGALNNVLGAYRFYNGLKAANFGTILSNTIGQIGLSVLNGAINGALAGVYFPTFGGVAGYGGVYGSSMLYGALGVAAFSPYGAPIKDLGAAIKGAAEGIVLGAAVNVINQAANNIVADLTRGVAGNNGYYGGGMAYGAANSVYDVSRPTSRFVQLDEWGNPLAGQGTVGAVTTNAQGRQVAATRTNPDVVGAANRTGPQPDNLPNLGAYNPNYPMDSVTKKEFTTVDGKLIETRTYIGGARVTYDENNNVISIRAPGQGESGSVPNPQNNTPQIATNLYRDTQTGIIYDRSGTFGATLQNSISGATGAITGLYAGQSLNEALLQKTPLGSTILGRTIAGVTSGVIGSQVGVWVNNGVQLALNKISGEVKTAWNSATGEVGAVYDKWTHSGAYDPSNPDTNLVAAPKNVIATGIDGVDREYATLYTYKNGDQRGVDAAGNEYIVNVGPNSRWSPDQIGQSVSGTNTDSSSVIPTGYGVRDGSGNPVTSGSGIPWNQGTTISDQNYVIQENNRVSGFGTNNDLPQHPLAQRYLDADAAVAQNSYDPQIDASEYTEYPPFDEPPIDGY